MRAFRWILFVAMFSIILLTPTPAHPSTSDSEVTAPEGEFILQQDSDNVTRPIVVRILSPQDGDIVAYGPIEISFDIDSQHGINSLDLIASNEIIPIGRYDAPYTWKPKRDGQFLLILQCQDHLSNSGSDSIHIRVEVRNYSPSTIAFVAVFIGLLAVGSVVYKVRFENSPRWHEDPDYSKYISIPFHYVIFSKIKSRREKRESRLSNA